MDKFDFCNLNVGIIGIARSGIAVAKKLKNLKANVFLSDSNVAEKIKNNYICFNEKYSFNKFNEEFEVEYGQNSDKLLAMDLLIVSPGVPLTAPVIVKAKEKGLAIWSEIEFAYRLTNKKTKIIAVTGSNGKSTTVSLINHILLDNGYDSVLAGNIGYAYSGFDIENRHDFIVLELSSFQLDLIDSFKPDVAVLLNITPDHLNRYNTFEDYALSKFNIMKNISDIDNESFVVLNAEDRMVLKMLKTVKENLYISDQKIKYFSTKSSDSFIEGDYLVLSNYNSNKLKINTKSFPLLGEHNKLNMLAAILAVEPFIKNEKELIDSLKTFKPLEHRLEIVDVLNKREDNNIRFINDSKATNTDSVRYALNSFNPDKKQVHLLIGGSDKGEDYSTLLPYIEKYVKKIYLIGETIPKMNQTFIRFNDIEIFSANNKDAGKLKFEEAIRTAFNNAVSDDVILLSPACASFDWFDNFEDRGNQFKNIVIKIKNEQLIK
ncbi:MAG: UDP-N-acetylmuramoyl-L-alanine--D-glutamate ligase [Candidatus Cloacimonetes bacterium]|jgi:UDP-N-acetylmuramoylalanine--D-glutamate ligase|nr:UDP-N-acetylmuramoyl-L-alanine--D-glutamate ligase [Candidatus Cloacimonadota bacterium]MDD4156214.1 UDP-N-acetylmuramoyl-L-alanine--D-glutamate ligase [Candidatus Cloacimonadota bacterium]